MIERKLKQPNNSAEWDIDRLFIQSPKHIYLPSL